MAGREGRPRAADSGAGSGGAAQPAPTGVAPAAGFRGNKRALPQKPCVACGRPMTWRKRWRNTWDEVKYCSDACRRAGSPRRA